MRAACARTIIKQVQQQERVRGVKMWRNTLTRGAPMALRAFRLRGGGGGGGSGGESLAIHKKDTKAREISEEHSGVPQDVLDQVAIIGKPPPNSMQSLDYLNFWEIRFPEGRQWNEQLMGWSKTNGVSRWARELMRFPTREAAVSFCERNALSYQVENEAAVLYNKKNYGDKFKFRATKKSGDVDLV